MIETRTHICDGISYVAPAVRLVEPSPPGSAGGPAPAVRYVEGRIYIVDETEAQL